MRTRLIPGTLALAAMAACATSGTRIGSAGGDVMLGTVDTTTLPPPLIIPPASPLPSMTPPPLLMDDFGSAYSSPLLGVTERVRILDARAAEIDRLTGLGFNTLMLADDQYPGWSQMERWDDASGVRKIRVLPTLDRNDTEEFYYDNGRLIMVYWNPLGTFSQDAFGEPGESFYFGEEGLIAWTRDDGTTFDSSHPDFAYWDKHLRKESKRLLRCC
jgi:hypothetical protein